MRNTQPPNIWQALRRLLLCNKQQLADRLGVSREALRSWEQATEAGQDPGANAKRRAADLLITVLRSADGADELTRLSCRFPG